MVDSEFHTEFKTGFSFSVRMISISNKTSKVLVGFENVCDFSVPPLNNFTQQDSFRGCVSITENEPKSSFCKASQWLLQNIKKPQNSGGLDGNGDQSDRKTKTRFEIRVT